MHRWLHIPRWEWWVKALAVLGGIAALLYIFDFFHIRPAATALESLVIYSSATWGVLNLAACLILCAVSYYLAGRRDGLLSIERGKRITLTKHLKDAESILILAGKIEFLAAYAESLAYQLTRRFTATTYAVGDNNALIKDLDDYGKFVDRFDIYKTQLSSVAIHGLDSDILKHKNIESLRVRDVEAQLYQHGRDLNACGREVLKPYYEALSGE